MTALTEATARRIATLFRLLFSDHEGEARNALAAMKRMFKAEGLSPNDIGTVIENANGEIEQLKYSDHDAEVIFARGVDHGREVQARQHRREQYGPARFFESDGAPRWNAIALFCQDNYRKLSAKEYEFVDDMTGKTLSYEPTEKQGRWLMSIFYRLGGRRQ